MNRETVLSPRRRYRYCLWREWDRTNPRYAVFVGLNPSTADEVDDDPTIRRCIDYAKRWGYGALCMVNLFAYRATQPKLMKEHVAPVGDDNDFWLLEVVKDAEVVVAAWGTNGTHRGRDKAVMRLLAGRLSCLDKTKEGQPKHPLYLRKALEPHPFT